MSVLGWTYDCEVSSEVNIFGIGMPIALVIAPFLCPTPRARLQEQIKLVPNLKAFLPLSPNCQLSAQEVTAWTEARIDEVGACLDAVAGCHQMTAQFECEVEPEEGCCSWLRSKARQRRQTQSWQRELCACLERSTELPVSFRMGQTHLTADFLLPPDKADKIRNAIEFVRPKCKRCTVVSPLPVFGFAPVMVGPS